MQRPWQWPSPVAGRRMAQVRSEPVAQRTCSRGRSTRQKRNVWLADPVDEREGYGPDVHGGFLSGADLLSSRVVLQMSERRRFRGLITPRLLKLTRAPGRDRKASFNGWTSRCPACRTIQAIDLRRPRSSPRRRCDEPDPVAVMPLMSGRMRRSPNSCGYHGQASRTECASSTHGEWSAISNVTSVLPPSRPQHHNRTHAPQQQPSLFDHLIGSCEQRRRHGETKRLRGL
jgi:hypothetical protein